MDATSAPWIVRKTSEIRWNLEFFAWRDFQTSKQVGALACLTPTPYQSGQARRALGIAKATRRVVDERGHVRLG
jgi:transposase